MPTFPSYQLTGATLASQAQIGTVYSTEVVPVGTVVTGTDALGQFAEYIFLKGVASTIVGSVVTFDSSGQTALIAAGAIGRVAVALGLTVASTWGWYGLTGTFPTDVVANSAAGARIGRETTNGKVGDGFAAGDQLVSAMQGVTATTSAAVVNCFFNRAFAGVNVA